MKGDACLDKVVRHCEGKAKKEQDETLEFAAVKLPFTAANMRRREHRLEGDMWLCHGKGRRDGPANIDF